MGSWGPGTTRVPHPSDPESFPRFCPGLGLVPAPCQTQPGLWVGPLFPTPPGLAQGRKQERHVASDLNAERRGLCPV